MSQDKYLNIQNRFQHSYQILNNLNQKLHFFVNLPESSSEPYKIRFLRAMNEMAQIMSRYRADYTHLSEFAEIMKTQKLLLAQVHKFAKESGLPEITDVTTYLLAVAYQKALMVIKEFFELKRFIMLPGYPKKLQQIITSLDENLQNSGLAKEAESFLEEFQQVGKQETTNQQDSQVNRQQKQPTFLEQPPLFSQKIKNLESELSAKTALLLEKQKKLQQLNIEISQASTKAGHDNYQVRLDAMNLEIEYFENIAKLVPNTTNKKKRQQVAVEIEKKLDLENFFLELNLDIERILGKRYIKVKPAKLLEKFLSNDVIKIENNKKPLREFFIRKINETISRLSLHVERLKTQKIEQQTKLTSLTSENETLRKEISTIEEDIKKLVAKITHNESTRVSFVDEKDRNYYNKILEDLNLLQLCTDETKKIRTAINEFDYDPENVQKSYLFINDQHIKLEQLENSIKHLDGIAAEKKDQLLIELKSIANTLEFHEKKLERERYLYTRKNKKIESIKARLAEHGLEAMIEDSRLLFASFWNEKLESYWDYRCKKYAVKDFLSQCFFNNDKTTRHLFIMEIKALLSCYHFRKDDFIGRQLKEKIKDGIKQFSTGAFSNTGDDFKNLRGLLIKLDKAIQILDEELPQLRAM